MKYFYRCVVKLKITNLILFLEDIILGVKVYCFLNSQGSKNIKSIVLVVCNSQIKSPRRDKCS